MLRCDHRNMKVCVKTVLLKTAGAARPMSKLPINYQKWDRAAHGRRLCLTWSMRKYLYENSGRWAEKALLWAAATVLFLCFLGFRRTWWLYMNIC